MKSFKPLLALLLLWYSIPFSHGQTNIRHLEIQKITDGVYAAIHRNGGHGICNAGIIDLGDATVIFDCMLTPAAALELKDAAKELTGREAKYVVNSHYHNDHIRGNQVFTNATIISTNKTTTTADSQCLLVGTDPIEAAAHVDHGVGVVVGGNHRN